MSKEFDNSALKLELLKEHRAYLDQQIKLLETNHIDLGSLTYEIRESGNHVVCTRIDPTGCKIKIIDEPSLDDLLWRLEEFKEELDDLKYFLERILKGEQ